MEIRTLRKKSRATMINATSKDIRHMNATQRPWELRDLKDIATIVRSMDIKHMNVDLMPIGHQTSRHKYNKMENFTIRITT